MLISSVLDQDDYRPATVNLEAQRGNLSSYRCWAAGHESWM
jgi:hypothetical protein